MQKPTEDKTCEPVDEYMYAVCVLYPECYHGNSADVRNIFVQVEDSADRH